MLSSAEVGEIFPVAYYHQQTQHQQQQPRIFGEMLQVCTQR
jgi:hypothetical protein